LGGGDQCSFIINCFLFFVKRFTDVLFQKSLTPVLLF
jgi:hypothetical protein